MQRDVCCCRPAYLLERRRACVVVVELQERRTSATLARRSYALSILRAADMKCQWRFKGLAVTPGKTHGQPHLVILPATAYALGLHYSFLSVSDRGLAADHRSIRNSSCPAEIVDSDLLLIPPSLPASLQRFIPASTNLSQRMHRV